MKKSTKTISALFAMLLMALVSPAAAFAQWSWHDDFGDYVTGADLVGNGSWWQYSNSAVNPVKVGEGPLTYEGYPGGVTGKSITLAPSNSQRVYTVFNDYWNGLEKKESVRGITTGSVYYSMLLKVKSATAVQYATMTPYLASFVTCSAKPLADKGSGMEKGKFYVKADADGTGYVLGVNPTSAAANIKFTESLEYDKTYLVVVKYTLDGDLKGKDGMSLFVNPADFKTEPAPTADVPVGTGTGGVTPSSYSGTSGLSALLLRQANGVDAEVGCVRIADTWAGLFEVKSTADSPRILTAPSSIDFGALLQGEKMQKVINVRAKNLKGNITVAVPEGGNLSVSATEIPMEQALREEGFELTVTLDVKNPSLSGEQIVLSSEGAEDCVVKVTSDALPVSSLSTLKAFYGTDVKPGTIYRLATSPVLFHKQQISVADEVEGGTMFMDAYYLQDGTAGVVLMDPYIVLSSEGYAKGDAFNGLVGEVKSGKDYGFDFNVLVPVSRVKGSKLVNYSHVGSVTKNNPVTAVDVTLDQLNANRAEYVNRLIRVSGVNFENIEEDAVYTATTPLTLTDGKNKVDVLAFRGTTDDNGTSSDILGEPVPHGIINLTGISTYLSKTLIQPRGIADVEEVETQTISITVNGESTDLTVRRQEGDLPVVMKELTLDDAAQSLSVTSPFVAPGVKYVRNFANTEWQALYVPFAVDCEAWAADCDLAEIYNMHQYDDDEDGTIDRTELEVIKKVSGQLLPNVPYLIRAKEAGEKTLQLEDVTVVPTEQASVDCSSTKVAYAFNGIYTAITGSDMMNGGFYALSDGEIKQAASAEAGLHAFRWYMTATDRNGAPAPEQSIRIRLRGEDNQHTGIGSAAAGVTGVTVSAGTITVSAAPATVWNVCAADGRTVARIVTDANGNGTASRLATGVYIVGGKKVIVK